MNADDYSGRRLLISPLLVVESCGVKAGEFWHGVGEKKRVRNGLFVYDGQILDSLRSYASI